MRDIVFLNFYQKRSPKLGTIVLRSHQIIEELRDNKKLKARAVSFEETDILDEIRDSIIVLVRIFWGFGDSPDIHRVIPRLELVKKLKENNNIIILDATFAEEYHSLMKFGFYSGLEDLFKPIDVYISSNAQSKDVCTDLCRHIGPFDGVVEKNEEDAVFIKGSYRIVKTIHHHFDVRLNVDRKSFDEAKICFIGNIENLNFRMKNKISIIHVKRDPFLDMLNYYNTHFCVLNPNRKFKYAYKSNVKLAVAAGCRANIILSKSPSHVELVPKDYPYFLQKDSLFEIDKMIDFVKSSYGKDPWFYGLEIMDMLRERLSVSRIADDYIDLFKMIEERT